MATAAFDQLRHGGGRQAEMGDERVPTVISSPLQRRSQVRSIRCPLVVRTTRMTETLMTNIVKEKMPVRASFFRSSIDAFHRRLADSSITSVSSDLAY